MPKIRVVKVVFNTKIKAYEVPAFRGAVIDMIGREHVAFHNHIGENVYHYHYPYIQYKQQVHSNLKTILLWIKVYT